MVSVVWLIGVTGYWLIWDQRAQVLNEALRRAVSTAQPLFGREPTFDGLLKLMKHVDVSDLGLDDTLALAGLMSQHLQQ